MRQQIAAIVIHQTPDSPRNIRAGQKHTAQPTAIATVNQTADTRPFFRKDSVTQIDSFCYSVSEPFFVRTPDPVVAGGLAKKLRRRQNQDTHHKLSTPASSQPCGQASNQPPRTIPTPEPPKESHGPCDTPEPSEKSATYDVDSTRSFHETSDNVPQRSFPSAAATVAGRSGEECRSVTESSQSGMNWTTSFPGIGMRWSSTGNHSVGEKAVRLAVSGRATAEKVIAEIGCLCPPRSAFVERPYEAEPVVRRDAERISLSDCQPQMADFR